MIKAKPGFRSDIQGLRAIAVGLVLIYHVFPAALPGGFVGVDVFFVISGYLITGILLRESAQSGRIDFASFYARRVKRLFPAAAVVIAATLALTPFLTPHLSRSVVVDAAGSAFFFQNWVMAWRSIDYLALEAASSPLMHFWSLSIEEQFYLFWPGVLFLSLLASRKVNGPSLAPAFIAIMLVAATSFSLSVLAAADGSQVAYFHTYVRIWEMALGAGLAVLGERAMIRAGKAATAAAGVGLAFIVGSALILDADTAFPGWVAIWPTLGAALVLAAAPSNGHALSRVLSAPFMVWIGNQSYSLYLIHWPLIFFYTAQTGLQPGFFDGALLIVGSVSLAELSRRHVELRFQRGPQERDAQPRPIAARTVFAACSAVVLAGAGAVFVSAGRSAETTTSASLEEATHPGGLVLFTGRRPDEAPFTPTLPNALQDTATVYRLGCHVSAGDEIPAPCVFGPEDGRPSVVIAGDSHAANWIPALEAAAEAYDWRVTSYTKSGCPLVPGDITADLYGADCAAHAEAAIRQIEGAKPDALIFAQATFSGLLDSDGEAMQSWTRAVRETWDRLEAAGVQVIGVRDTPRVPFEPLACLRRNKDCSFAESQAYPRPDPVLILADVADVPVLDMGDAFCVDETCPLVIGNVLVWRDEHHFTASYARTLTPWFAGRLAGLLRAAGVEVGSMQAEATVFAAGEPAADHGPGPGVVAGHMRCSPLPPRWPESVRSYRLTLSAHGALSFKRGGDHPGNAFEQWSGEINEGRVSIEGEYGSVDDYANPVRLYGAFQDGVMVVGGKRGPRHCVFEGRFEPDAAES